MYNPGSGSGPGSGSKLGRNPGSGSKFNVFGSTTLVKSQKRRTASSITYSWGNPPPLKIKIEENSNTRNHLAQQITIDYFVGDLLCFYRASLPHIRSGAARRWAWWTAISSCGPPPPPPPAVWSRTLTIPTWRAHSGRSQRLYAVIF